MPSIRSILVTLAIIVAYDKVLKGMISRVIPGL